MNKVEQSCRALQVLKLEDGFELEANSKSLTDFHIQASLNKRLNFGNDYKFSNLPHSYFEEVEEDPSWVSPIIDDFLLDGTGSFHTGRVSGISVTLIIIIILICIGLCYKYENYRSCLLGCCMKLIPNKLVEQYNKCLLVKETEKLKDDLTVIDLANKVEHSERQRLRGMEKDSFEEVSEKVTIEDDRCITQK